MTTKVTKSGVGAIDQLSTGSVKHTSSPIDNITLDANGRVGIGTSSPATPLDVTKANGGNFVATFQNTSFSTPYGVFIKDAPSGANGYPLLQVTNSAGAHYFRVDSGTGYVTMPYQPAFFAAVDGGTANAIITNWGWVDVNIGNHFNATTGNFTAPVAGTYLFFANIMTGGSSYHFFQFRKNDGTNIGSYHHSASITSSYRHTSGSTIATLAANDTVSIYCGNTGPYTSGPNRWSGFGGHLLG